MKFGWEAPRYAETIWVSPADCRQAISTRFSGTKGFGEADSGRVITGEWPIGVPIGTLTPVSACLARYSLGVPWEETGIFEYIRKAKEPKCFIDSRDDVVKAFSRPPKKYVQLDIYFEKIKAEGRIRRRCELESVGLNSKRDFVQFREKGGVLIHVGPKGDIYFGGKGCNRFAIALVLGLKTIPAQLGCIHVSALDYLEKLRKSPERLSE